MNETLNCISCSEKYSADDVLYQCQCGGLLEVKRDYDSSQLNMDIIHSRTNTTDSVYKSGVWRFRECIANIHEEKIVSLIEGHTGLYEHRSYKEYSGCDQLQLKHEGQNPTGSFKDRGMTVAVSKAHALGKKRIACASTGNTSAALAAYAGSAGLEAIVFVPRGKIAMGKLSQAIGYGATIIQIEGDFDAAMTMVQQASKDLGLYLVNSLNPFRIEGQKTIIWEMLAQRNWEAPDWIVVPAGNLGNTSAFGKAVKEAHEWGWIKKIPRIASIQAAGANPFFTAYENKFTELKPVQAETVATAIRIGNPVNYEKAKRVIENTNGIVTQVSDEDILAAKKIIDASGVGCEPASACALAGTRKLVNAGVIGKDESAVGILTGNILKDADIIVEKSDKAIIQCDANIDAIKGQLS